MLDHTLISIFIGILIYFLALSTWYTVLLIASFPQVIKKFKETQNNSILELIDHQKVIPITIVIPAFNEENRILNTVYALLQSNYKNIRIIIVNDGSTDNMMELLNREFLLFKIPPVIKQTIKTSKILNYYESERFPNITVIDKEHSPYNNSGDSLNAGMNACQTPIMITVDADTILEPESLSRILFSFVSMEHCIAVSGSVYVLNEIAVEHGKMLKQQLPTRFVSAVQSVEYLRSFLLGRAGLNVFGGSLSYSGAFTLFETQILHDVGGFDDKNFANDSEIIIKLHHWMRKNDYPYTMQHTPNAFCWTEVPSTARSYWVQRDHWHRGMWRGAFRHIGMFLNPRYGIVGLLTFPFYILFEIMGPVIEFTSFFLFLIGLYFQLITFSVLLWFLFLAWGFVALLSIAMVFLNLISFNKYDRPRDTLYVMGLVFAEMLWFRQYRALCCTVATVRYFFNRLLGKPL